MQNKQPLSQTQSRVIEILEKFGASHWGWTKLSRPISMDLYKAWIEDQQHLDMSYLESHIQNKEAPQNWKAAQSAIVLAIPYLPHPWPSNQIPEYNSVALYAQGKDYHHEIPQHLSPILQKLRKQFPQDLFELFTDSSPVLERDLAYRAGLGWIGKNTCLIHPKHGSLFLIAEIYTSLVLESALPWSPDFCGSCNKCIESCPTQALSDHQLDPSRCISYWTIEAKSIAPEKLRSQIGSWLFGCDICQTVCPWNQKHLKQKVKQNISTREQKIQELKWILTSSRKALFKALRETPLARAAGWKLQRNAIIMAVNNNYFELKSSIESYCHDQKLSSLAHWALTRLHNESQ